MSPATTHETVHHGGASTYQGCTWSGRGRGNAGSPAMPAKCWRRWEQRPNVTNANGEGPQDRRTAAGHDSGKARGESTSKLTTLTKATAVEATGRDKGASPRPKAAGEPHQ